MREPTSIEFDNNLAKSLPDFGLTWSKYGNEKISQSIEFDTSDTVNENIQSNSSYNNFESESRVGKHLKEKKKKQHNNQQLQHFHTNNKSYKKSFSNKIKPGSDQLPMIRESTEFLDFSTDGTKYNLMKHTSFKLPKLVPDSSLTEASNDTSSFETEISLPEISIRRLSNYIPTIHLDHHPEKHYQSYNRFINSFKNRYADSSSNSNQNIDAINGTPFKLEPLLGKKLNKRIDSSNGNKIQRYSKLFP